MGRRTAGVESAQPIERYGRAGAADAGAGGAVGGSSRPSFFINRTRIGVFFEPFSSHATT
jgi:hypothetical protein